MVDISLVQLASLLDKIPDVVGRFVSEFGVEVQMMGFELDSLSDD
jgi:hypothetical protein